MDAKPLATPLTTDTGSEATKRKPRKAKLKNLMQRDGVWYFHKFVKGEREFSGRKTPFSLETRDLAVAQSKRDAILKAANGAEIDRITGKVTGAPEATIEEILAAYKLADYPRESSRTSGASCLRRVLRQALANPDLNRLTSLDLTPATKQAFQDFIVKRVRAAGHDDESEEMLVAKFSANRTFAKASSVWANEKCFRKLKVTRPVAFLGADDFISKRDMAFQPMTDAEVALFAAESQRAKETAPGVYATWLLMRWLGMRNKEVEYCKPSEWIVRGQTGGWVMRITNRDYFQVKGVGSLRALPLAEWLRDEILAIVGAKIEGDKVVGGREWLIAGDSPTEREVVTHRTINEWMAAVYASAIEAGTLPAGTQVRTAYDWRKQAGSALYHKTKDILQVSKWLGHQSVHVTTKWYVNLIGGLPSLA